MAFSAIIMSINMGDQMFIFYGAVFVYPGRLRGLYDSQATNRSVLEKGGHREHSLPPIGLLGVIYDS
jgi:hypothetical protein